MNIKKFGVAILAAINLPALALAGDEPLYEAEPGWITVHPLPSAEDSKGQQILILEAQDRLEDGRRWQYQDIAARMSAPEVISQFANLQFAWIPDKGDLIVHELSIVRGDEIIDALAEGQKFTVLRREEQLEQLQLTGVLTASMQVQGLRVGDILRARVSVTLRDDALDGNVQLIEPLVAEPVRMENASRTISWPTDTDVRWKLSGEAEQPKVVTRGAYDFLRIDLPLPKQPDMPADSPSRFQLFPLIEVATFDDWSKVSSVFAELYETGPAAGGIADKVSEISAEHSDPRARAAAALRSVQDDIRYFLVTMGGGNYVPQSPEETWEKRFGDCKAKTMLLLTMLHALDVEAEPVLVQLSGGDAVTDRLPAPQAFDHVVVRAVIDGEELWLDGTGMGTRLADLGNVPPYGWVLPIRAKGAELELVRATAPARPDVDLTLVADESGSPDLPSVIDVTVRMRNPVFAQLDSARSMMSETEFRNALSSGLNELVGEAQWKDLSLDYDADSAVATIAGRGVFTTGWKWDDQKKERWLSRLNNMVRFTPDRARPAWSDIPVQTNGPAYFRTRLEILLPSDATDYAIEGAQDFSGQLAGSAVDRSIRREGRRVIVEETFRTDAREIAAAEVAALRQAVADARNAAPKLVAPEDYPRVWEVPEGSSQLEKTEEVFQASFDMREDDDVTPMESRANLRIGMGDHEGAIEDLTAIIEIQPTRSIYFRRARTRASLGDMEGALEDAEAARALDPSNRSAVAATAEYLALLDRLDEGLALVDQRIEVGGEDSVSYRHQRGELLGLYGDADAGIAELEQLAEEEPSRPQVLNSLCWVKAVRGVSLDGAVKDCTAAIELGRRPYGFLDSRSLAWLRMGRLEDARRDNDTVLREVPEMMAARWIRGMILAAEGDNASAEEEFSLVRRMAPFTAYRYERLGLLPE